MASKNLYIIIILRVIFIMLTSVGFAFFILGKQFDLSIYFGVLIILQIIFLVKFLNKTNYKIAYFFNALENEDSTIYFTSSIKNKSIKELNDSLNRLNHHIQKVKIKNKSQEQYYQTILQEATIGILTINQNGHILLANNTAKKLLNYENLNHIQQLKKVNEKLFILVAQLKPFEEKSIQLVNERETVDLTVKATPIIIDEQSLLLVVVQNIRNELDAKEVDSWNSLIRVLTHEIMNSIAPITSLSETLSNFFKKEEGLIEPSEITENVIEKTVKGLDVIQNQGNDLINFVESYRSLTKIPIPEKKLILVSEMFDKIRILVSLVDGFDNIKFELSTNPENLKVFADEKQLTQVLVNLMKNALQSLVNEPNGVVELKGEKDAIGKITLSVSDNGSGIPQELIDQIFVPFFTTREKGTGIGLSLSKHIMRMHGGNIQVNSTPNKKTIFTLSF